MTTRHTLMLFMPVMLWLCGALPSQAQAARFTLDNTRLHQLESEETGQKHELVVVLPADYDASPDKTYPVLYYLDAYWDTPLLSAIYGNLVYDRLTPEFIMVGLSYPGNVNYGLERRRDYTPTTVGEDKGASGGGAAFLKFIKQTVVPLVESRYRADKTERALGGSSLGGLFTLYAMYQEPEFFDRYIAISPAVGWDDNYLFQLDKAYAKKHKALPARVFVSLGTAEYAPFRDPIAQFQKTFDARGYQGLQLLNYSMEGLRHASVKADGYTHGLMWVFKDITPKGPSGLELEINGS